MPPTPDSEHDDPEHHDGLLDRFDDFRHRVEEAAIQAEFETGEREETVEEAKANALVRAGRMTLGFTVTIIGIIALPLPGPGWLIIAAGLTILSKDVAWAERLLRYIRKRVPGIPEDGKIPRSSLATMAVITLAAVSASLWWTFARGSNEIQSGSYAVAELRGATDSTSASIEPDLVVLNIAEEGPLLVETDCGSVGIEVIERSKSEFELGQLTDPDWTCGNANGARVIDELTGATIDLRYSTDGIVEWFFADDQLSSIEVTDEAGTFRLDVAPA